jgi:type IV pilus assembly protein PilE
MQNMTSSLRQRGFTLIEVMITVAIVAILAAIALPAYTAYIQRSRVPVGLDALSSMATRMEQYYQDTGNYAKDGGCAIAPPADGTVANFTFTCALVGDAGQAFLITATGSGPLAGYEYTINQAGARATTDHPKNAGTMTCWSIRGGTCDD